MKKVVLIQVAPKFAEIIPIFCKECLKHNIFDTIYIASSTELSKLDNRCKIIHMESDLQFSSNILNALSCVPEEVIMLCCDDHIMIQEHNKQDFDETFNFILSNKDVGSILLCYSPKVKLQSSLGVVGEIIPSSRYLLSLRASWFRKDYLVKVLRHGENAWETEANGTIRSRNCLGFKKYCVTRPVFFETNFYHKGQFLSSDFVEYAINNRIKIKNILPVYTRCLVGSRVRVGYTSLVEYRLNRRKGILNKMVVRNPKWKS
jgi:hypothetical protein